MTSEKGLLLAECNWQEVQMALEAGATAILPIGAAAKQHGLHLPMSADFLQAEWLAKRLVQAAPVVVWPTISYGHYPAFVDYPGSCSLSRATFQSLATQIIDDLLRAGSRTVIVLNTGISTIRPLEMAIENSSRPARVRLANIYEGANYRAAEERLREQPRGSHADELETSIMLAIAREKVRMDKAQPCVQEMVAGPMNRTNPHGPNYSPSGVYGDPRLASKEKGEALLKAMIDDLLTLIDGAPA
jgi:creatinine amidohydrolase